MPGKKGGADQRGVAHMQQGLGSWVGLTQARKCGQPWRKRGQTGCWGWCIGLCVTEQCIAIVITVTINEGAHLHVSFGQAGVHAAAYICCKDRQGP